MATLSEIAEQAGFIIPGLGKTGFMSSFAQQLIYPLVIEQIPVNGYKGSGLKFEFIDRDLPNDLKVGGRLHKVRKNYPNNTIPDTQVIRTEENLITLEGTFDTVDKFGRKPMDKIELLEAMRLEGIPCRLDYMGGRIIRLGFIEEFVYTIFDERNIDWELRFEPYQIGDQVQTNSNLGAPLTSPQGRALDINGRLNANQAAVVEMQARMSAAGVSRDLREELIPTNSPLNEAMNNMQAAKDSYNKNPDIASMSVKQFKDLSNKVNAAAKAVHTATSIVRTASINPVKAAERALGWTGQFKRQQLVREASITFGRVSEDLEQMGKDLNRTFNKKSTVHLVSEGDTLRSISYKYYGTSERWADIARSNNVVDPSNISGRRLVIP